MVRNPVESGLEPGTDLEEREFQVLAVPVPGVPCSFQFQFKLFSLNQVSDLAALTPEIITLSFYVYNLYFYKF